MKFWCGTNIHTGGIFFYCVILSSGVCVCSVDTAIHPRLIYQEQNFSKIYSHPDSSRHFTAADVIGTISMCIYLSSVGEIGITNNSTTAAEALIFVYSDGHWSTSYITQFQRNNNTKMIERGFYDNSHHYTLCPPWYHCGSQHLGPR